MVGRAFSAADTRQYFFFAHALLGTLTIVFSAAASTVLAADNLKLPRVVISEGGPYFARGGQEVNYSGYINLPAEFVAQPLSLVCTNGSTVSAGFNWVRMFLAPGAADSSFQSGAQRTGRLLVDERSFLNTAQVSIDLSSGLNSGKTGIFIEGAGPPGASFQWELRTVGPPVLQPSVVTTAGAIATVWGEGFSLRKEENQVMLGNRPVPVAETSPNYLRFYVPVGQAPGTYPLTVSIWNFQSKAAKILVLPGPNLQSLSPVPVRSGQVIYLRGSGFSESTAANVVYVGKARVAVLASSSTTLTIVAPPVAKESRLPVTVFVNGAQASGELNALITPF